MQHRFLAILMFCALYFCGCSSATKVDEKNIGNISLTLEECKDHAFTSQEQSEGAKALYLRAENVSENQMFDLIFHNMYGDQKCGKFRLQDGELRSIDPKDPTPLSQYIIVQSNCMKAQPVEYRLVTPSGKVAAKAKFILHPVEVIGKDGCKISLEMMDDPDAKMFAVYATGFKPGESVIISSVSGDECMTSTVEVPESGKIIVPYFPSVVGKQGGTAQLSFTRSEETLRIDCDWGEEALKTVTRPSAQKPEV